MEDWQRGPPRQDLAWELSFDPAKATKPQGHRGQECSLGVFLSFGQIQNEKCPYAVFWKLQEFPDKFSAR